MGAQPALEALPLIMEPESRMYCSPVVVLDFQSLYPSLVIAYNLCYTTCLGRAQHASASEWVGSDITVQGKAALSSLLTEQPTAAAF